MKYHIVFLILLLISTGLHSQNTLPPEMEQASEFLFTDQFQKAISILNKYIDESTHEIGDGPFYIRGLAKMGSEDYKGAIIDFTHAIERDPNNKNKNYIHRGDCKFILTGYRGAFRDYNRSIEIDPSDHMGFLGRGKCHLVNEEYKEGIADLLTSISLSPSDNQCHFFLGLAQLSVGQINEACLSFSRSGELGHKNAYEMIRQFCN